MPPSKNLDLKKHVHLCFPTVEQLVYHSHIKQATSSRHCTSVPSLHAHTTTVCTCAPLVSLLTPSCDFAEDPHTVKNPTQLSSKTIRFAVSPSLQYTHTILSEVHRSRSDVAHMEKWLLLGRDVHGHFHWHSSGWWTCASDHSHKGTPHS